MSKTGPLADVLGGLADDAEQTFGLTGERHHAHAHQFLLQAVIQSRLGKDGRIGVIEILQQVLLHRRHVVHRLGHEPGQFLEAGETVELERIELCLAFRRMGNAGLNLAFGLDFNLAQLTAQADNVFGQVEQRTLQAAHLAFDPGPRNRQLTGLIDQAIDQVGPNAQRCPLAAGLGVAFALGQRQWPATRSGSAASVVGSTSSRHFLRPGAQALDG